jgi:hypothetical protein
LSSHSNKAITNSLAEGLTWIERLNIMYRAHEVIEIPKKIKLY